MFARSQRLFALAFGLSVLALCWMTFATAEQKPGAKPVTITVTGCLHKGNVVDRFSLTGQDHKSYALRSSAVKLADHVGHKVTIKGELKHDQKRDDYDFEGSEVNEEYGKGKVSDPLDVLVSSLKMIGASCR
jgi:hypothetical protein